MIAQGISHTAYDTMKEYMLTGAELDRIQVGSYPHLHI